MMVRDSEGHYEAIDFRESAPAAAYENMYEGNVEGSKFGGLSAGVPSEVAGLEYAHKKYGVRPVTFVFVLRSDTDKSPSGPSLETGHGRGHSRG